MKKIKFPIIFSEVQQRIQQIKPIKYSNTRNYIDGSVSYLSPYISRGIISTKDIFKHVLNLDYSVKQSEKFIQELTWRDYWQQIWIAKENEINFDLKNKQLKVSNTTISKSIVEANTGIKALDNAIINFYENGYLHNHLRMYIASLACNIAQSHWSFPAKWMYYHLLDADWASNALSWQWVAGTNSNKKYFANQDNINKYCYTKQSNTFLDISYDDFETLQIPKELIETDSFILKTPLPAKSPIEIDNKRPTYIYNFYNLDPLWSKEISANRILLLEPSHFKKYPISHNSMGFMLGFSKNNIDNIQVYVGEFNDFILDHAPTEVNYKEHPLNSHYTGIKVSRDFIFDVKGYYPSFFSFWKKCKKELIY